MFSAGSRGRSADCWAAVRVFFVGNRERLAESRGGNEPLVAGRRPAKSGKDALLHRAGVLSFCCSQFTHRFCGGALFSTAQGNFSLINHLVDVVGHLRLLAGLGQEPGDVEISLSPCLVVNFSLHDSKTRWIMDQAFEPFRLAPVNNRPVCSATAAGNGTGGPLGR